MSYVPADVMYEQLQRLLNEGQDLSRYKVDGCDSFAGEAIIYEKEADEE
jgi:hypothetical protein